MNGKKALVGIRGRLIMSVLIPLVIILTALGAFLTVQVGDIVEELKSETITQQVDVAVLEVEKFFNSSFTGAYMTTELNSIVAMVGDVEANGSAYNCKQSPVFNSVMNDLQMVAANLGEGVAVWLVTTENGQLILPPDYITDPGFDYASRPWYKLVEANPDKPAVTGAYEDVATGNLVVTVAVPVMGSGNSIDAVIGVDIPIDSLSSTLGNINIGENGYVVAYDLDNNIVYHPSDDMTLVNVADTTFSQEVKDSVLNSQALSLMACTEGESELYGLSKTIDGLGWTIFGFMPSDEFMTEQEAVFS